MNSRQRRKQAAQEHNDRIELMQELSELRLAIYTKHGVRVRVEIDSRNYSVRQEIARLRGILGADTPPPRRAFCSFPSSFLIKSLHVPQS
ncbi:hypothetical protein ST4_096 [Aeromonas phage ST4]|nr:hypothetical protein ST4_096 [Aeromonas phage ST4]